MKLVVAPDKFKGTLGAREAALAMARGARRAGWDADEVPLADGGEGTLEVFGGANRATLVSGPLGDPVRAGWRLDGELAVIEMAEASGLGLVGGRGANDPIRATTLGTGELLLAAMEAGATRVIVGVGGSASTDGGAGALEALGSTTFADRGVNVQVACDVDTPFRDAARIFGPQKGATAGEVNRLEARLDALIVRYDRQFGAHVADLPYAGAAGGLAGGLLALGAQLCSGFELIADAVHLDERLSGAALVLTGEGRFDTTSLAGKVVGGVIERAARQDISVLVIAGEIAEELSGGWPSISLVEHYGRTRSLQATSSCLEEAVHDRLGASTTEHETS